MIPWTLPRRCFPPHSGTDDSSGCPSSFPLISELRMAEKFLFVPPFSLPPPSIEMPGIRGEDLPGPMERQWICDPNRSHCRTAPIMVTPPFFFFSSCSLFFQLDTLVLFRDGDLMSAASFLVFFFRREFRRWYAAAISASPFRACCFFSLYLARLLWSSKPLSILLDRRLKSI